MPVDYKSAAERYKLTDQINQYVFFGQSYRNEQSGIPILTHMLDDIFNTKESTTEDPLAGIWFRIEKGGPPVGPGIHGYDESGVVYEGTIQFSTMTAGFTVND